MHVIPTEFAHIVLTPGVVGGEPRIDGHRIRVRDIVAARDLGGYVAEEIAATIYPTLTLSEVYAALAYYEDHRADIDNAAVKEAEVAANFLTEHPELVRHSVPTPE